MVIREHRLHEEALAAAEELVGVLGCVIFQSCGGGHLVRFVICRHRQAYIVQAFAVELHVAGLGFELHA